MVVDWCCMCKKNGETTDHLLLCCPVSQELWNMVCSLFGVQWVMPCSVMELLACWSNKFNKLRSKELWRIIPHCLMWVIWRVRNTHTFDGNERSIHELKLLFFQTFLIGQMLRVFLLLFHYLICLIFVLSLLVFFPVASRTQPVCLSSLCIFSSFFQ